MEACSLVAIGLGLTAASFVLFYQIAPDEAFMSAMIGATAQLAGFVARASSREFTGNEFVTLSR